MIVIPGNIDRGEIYTLFIIFVIIAGIIRCIYLYIQDRIKNRKIIKYNYQKKKRKKQSQEAIKRYNTYKKYDSEMFSNEPLDYEGAKNMKYRAYTQAQWDELKK